MGTPSYSALCFLMSPCFLCGLPLASWGSTSLWLSDKLYSILLHGLPGAGGWQTCQCSQATVLQCFFLVLVSQPDPIFIESAHVSFAYLSLMRRILWLWALARLSCSRQSKETRLDLFLRALQKCKVPHQVECLVLGVQGLGCRV